MRAFSASAYPTDSDLSRAEIPIRRTARVLPEAVPRLF
jgi:hypothetical protein